MNVKMLYGFVWLSRGRVAVCHEYANNISCSSKLRECYNELRNY